MIDSPSPTRQPKLQAPFSPPQSPFNPSLPLFPEYKFPPPARARVTPLREFTPAEPMKHEPVDSVHIEETIAEETEPPSQEIAEAEADSPKDSDSQVEEELALTPVADDAGALVLQTPSEVYRPTASQVTARVFIWLLILVAAYVAFNYKVESSSIGYCNRGSNTSQALENILSRRATIDACIKEGRPFLEVPSLHNSSPQELQKVDEACPLPPLLPIPQPSSCTACPAHATCTQRSVVCDSGYLKKPHILLSFIPVTPSQSALTTTHAPELTALFFKGVSTLTDGLPGFGSVGLPPRCVEDPKRKRHIGNLGKAMETTLAKERGKRVCRGDHTGASESEEGPKDAMKWGIEIGQLKESFKKTVSVSRAHAFVSYCSVYLITVHLQPTLLPSFDDMFNEAIQQLTQWGGVIVGEADEYVS